MRQQRVKGCFFVLTAFSCYQSVALSIIIHILRGAAAEVLNLFCACFGSRQVSLVRGDKVER